jgi:hypothetical protein
LAEDPAVRARYECKVITIPGPQTVPIKRCADATWYANRVLETVGVFLPQIHQQRVGNVIEAMLRHPTENSVRPTKADCDAAQNDANNHEPGRKGRWTDEYNDCLKDRALAEKPMPHNYPRTRHRMAAVTVERCASLQRVHDLQFKFPAFMGQQHRDKVLDPNPLPVNDQDEAAVAV